MDQPTDARPGQPLQEPRWLSADELQTWMALVALMVRMPATIDSRLLRDAGLTLFEYGVLAHLSESPDGCRRMSDLAVMANGSRSRLSHVVSRLEAQGLVRRETRAGVGRVTLAVLTEEGRAKLVDTAPGHVAHVRELVFDRLSTTQQHGLRRAARLLLEGLDGGCRTPGC